MAIYIGIYEQKVSAAKVTAKSLYIYSCYVYRCRRAVN
jgi:hypothetical protein